MLRLIRSSVYLPFVVAAVLVVGCSHVKKNLALNEAARHGTTADMETALATGADVNMVGESDNTPLIEAAIFDNDAAADFLIKHGADLNKGDEDHDGPLYFAADKDSRKVAKLLIAAGARSIRSMTTGRRRSMWPRRTAILKSCRCCSPPAPIRACAPTTVNRRTRWRSRTIIPRSLKLFEAKMPKQ